MQKVKDVTLSIVRSIDLDLVMPKMAYFWYLGSMGPVYPILSLWMHHRGLSRAQTGALWSTRPFISFLALPLVGVLADKLKIHKALLLSLTAISVLLRLIMLAEPWVIWISVFFMLSELSGTPVGSLLDAGVIEYLGPERHHLYGKQRVWGSFSYGGVAFLIGAIVSAAGGNFNIYFGLHAAMALVALGIFTRLSVSSVATPAPLWKSIGIVFSNIHVFVFFLVVTMIGAVMGAIGSTLFLVLDEMNGSRTVMGLATAVACLAEMPFFFFSSPLLRYIGERNMIYMACVGGIFRVIWYTWMRDPWFVLIAETMHGPFFGALWVAAMSYIHKIAPPGLGATAQGLLGGLYGGLGNGSGALVAGILYQQYGYVVLFRSLAVFLFFALIIFFGTNAFFKQTNPEEIGHAVATAESVATRHALDLELDIKTVSSTDSMRTLITNSSEPTSPAEISRALEPESDTTTSMTTSGAFSDSDTSETTSPSFTPDCHSPSATSSHPT